MTDDDSRLIDAARAKFGDEETDEYLRLMKAMRGLIRLWREYIRLPEGSPQEEMVGLAMNDMIARSLRRPDKAMALFQAMLAIIEHMREGGTYEEWYEDAGLSPEPGEGN